MSGKIVLARNINWKYIGNQTFLLQAQCIEDIDRKKGDSFWRSNYRKIYFPCCCYSVLYFHGSLLQTTWQHGENIKYVNTLHTLFIFNPNKYRLTKSFVIEDTYIFFIQLKIYFQSFNWLTTTLFLWQSSWSASQHQVL